MKSAGNIIGCALGFAVFASVSALSAKTYVAVPTIEWKALLPYVQANIVPELQGTEFSVFVCSAHTDRSVIVPFDEGLSDFAQVLITQGMRNDPELANALESITERFRARVAALTPAEHAGYRRLFWESLALSPEVLPRLKAEFEAAQSKGRLRCWLREKNAGYAPAAQRL